MYEYVFAFAFKVWPLQKGLDTWHILWQWLLASFSILIIVVCILWSPEQDAKPQIAPVACINKSHRTMFILFMFLLCSLNILLLFLCCYLAAATLEICCHCGTDKGVLFFPRLQSLCTLVNSYGLSSITICLIQIYNFCVVCHCHWYIYLQSSALSAV